MSGAISIDKLEEMRRQRANGVLKPRFRKCTDLGNAERLIDQHGHMLRYCSDLGRLVWDEQKWAVDKLRVWERCCASVARGIYGEAERCDEPAMRKAVGDWGRKSEASERLRAMAKVAESIKGVACTVEDLDADPFALNVTNGTIDLRTAKLSPHDPKNLITKVAGTAYDPEAKCPTFDAFMVQVFDGNEDLIGFLQRFIGYTLTADVREQVLLFCHGQGANGKSTFIDLVIDMLGGFGGYACPAAPGLLIAKKGEQHPTELADLRGARLVTCVEIGDGKRFDEERVKALTGGDRVKARFMRENFFTFQPSHKLILAANHKPQIRGTDLAIWRRILLVPFNVTFTDAQKDRALPQKLRAELPGILAWAVRGCIEWQRAGLRPPPVVTEATDAYRSEQDAIGRFIEDRCTVVNLVRASSASLYGAYKEWASDAGEHVMSQRRFGESLIERGFEQCRLTGGTRAWSGIGLAATDHDDHRYGRQWS